MKKLLTFVFILFSCTANAGQLQLGINTGPVMARNADFNSGNTKTAFHLMVGLNASYGIECGSAFCQGLFLEPSFEFTLPATTHFGSTRIASTGLLGNYSESQKIYSGQLNLKKHFRVGQKFTLFAMTGIGISYFELSKIRFTDALGATLPLNISTSSLNPHLNLGAGLTYAAGDKFLLSLGFVPHIVVTAIADQSYLSIPVGLNYAF